MAGIANHINEGGDKAVENYREYSIVREVTIPNQPAKGFWGIELVSPVYPATWQWAGDLEVIFSTVRHHFVASPSSHCSTHIHVSGTPLPLLPDELSALAKAALYFEAALDQLVPADRRGSAAYWCQSNRGSVALASLGLYECLGMIDAAVAVPASSASAGNESIENARTRALVASMNLIPATSTYGRVHGKKHDFIRGKVYKWDFSRMLPCRPSLPSSGGSGATAAPAQGTVEYRQAPGSRCAEDAKGWVTLMLAFVAGVTQTTAWGPLGVGEAEGATIGELWAVIVTGASVLGWDTVEDAAAIFAKRNA